MANIRRISIVSPVYRAEKIVGELVRQLHENVSKITDNYEIILVNDASPDDSWLAIVNECKKDVRVKGINLSRNFGQHYAITAGLSYAQGEWVVVMDCDLQDRPDEIPNLYNKAQEGWDIVYARRVERQDTFFKRLSSKLFHAIYSYLSGIETDKSIANFGIFNHKVIAEYNRMKEYTRSFPSLVEYLGFKKTAIDVQHYAIARTKDSLNDFAANSRCKPVYMDVTDVTSVKSLFMQIKKKEGHLDILVNNAGMMKDALIGMISREQIEQMYAVNVFAVIEMIQYASKFFKRQQSGSIINLASIMGVQGDVGQLLYGSTKGAVVALTKSAAKELAPFGTRVNAIAPGAIDTDMLRSIGEANVNKLLQNVYIGRLGLPKDVAKTALYLASDLSEYVTGQIIGVDGAMIV
jgi:NAD(P)-dependent dehydrogenase (short-subunit alcohol dehydrogenase family)